MKQWSWHNFKSNMARLLSVWISQLLMNSQSAVINECSPTTMLISDDLSSTLPHNFF